LDYSKTKLVERELLLIKVSILGPEHLHEQLPTAKLDDDVEYEDENVSRYKNVRMNIQNECT
jgi:acetolactate synthase-1/3 small subunit